MKKLLTKFTIFAILGIFFSVYFGEILHIDARAGHSSSWSGSSSSRSGSSSSRSSKRDTRDGIIVISIMILYCAIYAIRRQQMLKKAKKDLADALKDDSSWNLD